MLNPNTISDHFKSALHRFKIGTRRYEVDQELLRSSAHNAKLPDVMKISSSQDSWPKPQPIIKHYPSMTPDLTPSASTHNYACGAAVGLVVRIRLSQEEHDSMHEDVEEFIQLLEKKVVEGKRSNHGSAVGRWSASAKLPWRMSCGRWKVQPA